jgi:hypothetical protein
MRLAASLLGPALAPASALAQSPLAPDLLGDWQHDRAIVPAYIEAMRDSSLAHRPTPGARSLAERFSAHRRDQSQSRRDRATRALPPSEGGDSAPLRDAVLGMTSFEA